MAGTVGTVPRTNWLPTSFINTHVRGTDGLPGYGGYDWFRPRGTIVGAPMAGKVERDRPFTAGYPGGPYGRSLYVKFADGTRAYLTHFESLFVKAGDTVQAGDPLGRVGDTPGTDDHIHIGVEGTKYQQKVTLGSGRPTSGSQGFLADVLGGVGWSPGGGVSIGGHEGADLIPDPPGYGLIKDLPGALGWVTGNWDRILQVIGGLLLLLVGVNRLAGQLGMPTPAAAVPLARAAR